MRPVVGGYVPPDRVVGRDDDIRRIWNALENQSVVLVSERRIGKTSVIRKMGKEPIDGWYPVYLVIEGVRSPSEFISKIVEAVSPILSKKGRALTKFRQMCVELGGGSIGSWTLPQFKENWKRLLQTTLNDIRDNFDETVLFLWDELPLMISNIKDDLGVKTAMELLDILRDHRIADDSGKLRMIYTGSVGLHLVISELYHAGYRNDPTNDMATFALEGLGPRYAGELACQGLQELMDDGEIELRDSLDGVGRTIAAATDGLPFYINYAVETLSEFRQPIGCEDAVSAIDGLLLDPEDKAHFGHYAERIQAYYPSRFQQRDIAFEILKSLCRSDESLGEDDILNHVAAQMVVTDRNLFQRVLGLLVKDHYLRRDHDEKNRLYQFKYDIIRRWWLKNRG
ncbi:MAG: hypothetical protein HY788_09295 [Deltaproteobacteria bacterium]|nr:hypothetical protein [Deltaproteobacteria bacterium]